MVSMKSNISFRQEHKLDFKALKDLTTILHKDDEHRFRQTVRKIRGSVEEFQLNILGCISGHEI